MATNTKQLLNNQELCKKLGGSSSAKTVLNAGEILSNWNNVYLVGNLTGKVVPNNGEVRPVFNLKYGSTPLNAYNNNSTTAINVKDDSWDSSANFSINDGCYFYNGASAVSTGNYMETSPTNGGGYTYYITNSSGQVTRNIYYPQNFTWNSQIVTVDKNGTVVNAGFTTNETNHTIVTPIRRFNIAGTSSQNDTTLSASISGYNVVLARDQINSSYPISYVRIQGVHYGTNYTHSLLVVPPWEISANNISNISYLGSTVTPQISSNTSSYTLTKASSSDTWYTINNNSIVINGNTTHYDRSATINVSETISGSYTYPSSGETISYSSGVITTSFTITQNKTPDVDLYVVWYPGSNINKYYLMTSQNVSYSDLNNNTLYPAPGKIGIAPITIHVGLNNRIPTPDDYVEYTCLGQFIYSGDNSVSLAWTQKEDDAHNKIYYERGEAQIGEIALGNGRSNYVITSPQSGNVSVSWGGGTPVGYNLHNTLIIK